MELDNPIFYLDENGPETKEMNIRLFDFIYISNDSSNYLELANFIEAHLLTKKDAEKVFGQIYEIIEDTDDTDYDKYHKAFLLAKQILSNNRRKGLNIFETVLANNSTLFEEFYDKIKVRVDEQEEFKDVINLYHELKIIFDEYTEFTKGVTIIKPRMSERVRKSLKIITEDNIHALIVDHFDNGKQRLSKRISLLDQNQKITFLEKFREEYVKEETISKNDIQNAGISDKIAVKNCESVENLESKELEHANHKVMCANLNTTDEKDFYFSNTIAISKVLETSNKILNVEGDNENLLTNLIKFQNNFSTKRNKRDSINLLNKLPTIQKKLIEEPTYVNEDTQNDINIYFNKNSTKEISFISIHLLLKYFMQNKEFNNIDNKLIKAFILQKSGIINTKNFTELIYSFIEKSDIENNSEQFHTGLGVILINWVYYRFEDEIFNNPELHTNIIKFLEIILSKQPEIKFNNKIISIRELISIIESTQVKLDNKSDEKFISFHRNKSVQKVKHFLAIEEAINNNISSQFYNTDRILPNSSQDHFEITQWSEIEIARQITLITNYIFSSIHPKELINSQWTKHNKTIESPHVVKMIDRFNKLSFWVCEEILVYDKAKFRARIIEKFILIANELRNINNFNDAFAIIIALNSYQIKSLQKSWNIITLERIVIFKDLDDLFSYSNNFGVLRKEMDKIVNEPCIPYLGYFLKELAFLDEGPKYVKDTNLVNIEKITKIQKVFDKILKYQSIDYRFNPVYKLSFLADPSPMNEDQLTELSGKLEPFFNLAVRKSKSKRLTKTDLADPAVNSTFKDFIIFYNRLTVNTSIREKIKVLSES